MKSCIVKTAVLALAVSLFSLLGCETVVTDVNAELAAIYPEEDLGIPVKLNENYIEVAYNPSVESEENTEVKEEIKEDESEDNTETVSESDNTETEDASVSAKDDNDSDDSDDDEADVTEDDDAEGEGEDADTSEGEEGEDADTSEGEETEDEGSEEDLNASMAEENFDAEFYAATYPDVVAVFGNSPEALYKHYKDYGKAEGRSCNAEEFALLNENTN